MKKSKIIDRFEHPKLFREAFLKHYKRNHVADLDPTSNGADQLIGGFFVSEKGWTLSLMKGYQKLNDEQIKTK